MSGHAEAIVIQLTGKLVPLTSQIRCLFLSLSVAPLPFCPSLVSTSAFRCTSVECTLHLPPSISLFFLFDLLCSLLLLPA